MRDPVKAKARRLRYLRKRRIAKYGIEFADVNMTGRHGNHAKGERNGRWNHGTLVTSHGYEIVRVRHDHPRAFGPPGSNHKYAYAHDIAMEAIIGRPLLPNEVVHHKNGNPIDNSISNLELKTHSGHAREHSEFPGARDSLGRFNTNLRHKEEDLRVQQWPKGAER